MDYTKWASIYLCWYSHFWASDQLLPSCNHMRMMECPGGNKTFPFFSSDFTSTCNTTECWLTVYMIELRHGAVNRKQTGWESIFIIAGISATSAKIYAQTFSSEEITRDSLHMLDSMMLKELGIKTMGNVLAILKLTKEPSVLPASYIRLPTAKLPQLSSEMTSQQTHKYGSVYSYADIATPGLVTNCCPRIGLNHVCMMECPGSHNTFPFLNSNFKSACNATECWLTVYMIKLWYLDSDYLSNHKRSTCKKSQSNTIVCRFLQGI